MIAFPLDNTEYSAVALGAWCGTRTRGVFSAESHYTVTANGDLSVTVGAGLGWLHMSDYWGINVFESDPTVLSVDIADGNFARIDAVCIQLDKAANTANIIIKKGTPGAAPVIVPPVRDTNYDEIYIATITIPAGAVALTQANITDQRLNEAYCGVMRNGITGIPTQQLYDQWSSWMANFTQEAQDYYTNYQTMVSDAYTAYLAQLATTQGQATDAYNQFVSDMTAWQTQSQSDFDVWWQEMKDIIDEDALGHLLEDMAALQARMDIIEPLANTANTNATTALANASDALNTANSAMTAANAAQNTANTANTAAANAMTQANNAYRAYTATLPTTGWATSGSAAGTLQYTVTAAAVAANDMLAVHPANFNSQELAVAAGISPYVDTLAGSFRVYSNAVPTAAISIQYSIRKAGI